MMFLAQKTTPKKVVSTMFEPRQNSELPVPFRFSSAHTIHVGYIYLQLVDFHGKCR